MALLTDQKVGGSSPSERAKQVRRSGPPTGSTNPFTWVGLVELLRPAFIATELPTGSRPRQGVGEVGRTCFPEHPRFLQGSTPCR